MELIRIYGYVPGVILCELAYANTFWLNSFPAKDGVSTTLIPRAMITGQSVELTKHCLVEFRYYVHTHEDRDNSMESQTLKALELIPTGNRQDGQCFLKLYTGRVITRFTWTVLLLPTLIYKLFRRIVR